MIDTNVCTRHWPFFFSTSCHATHLYVSCFVLIFSKQIKTALQIKVKNMKMLPSLFILPSIKQWNRCTCTSEAIYNKTHMHCVAVNMLRMQSLFKKKKVKNKKRKWLICTHAFTFFPSSLIQSWIYHSFYCCSCCFGKYFVRNFFLLFLSLLDSKYRWQRKKK